MSAYWKTVAPLMELIAKANEFDVKTVETTLTLREFAAAMLTYQPAWVTFLYRVRGAFIPLLGLKQEQFPTPPKMTPATLPMETGQTASFFTVVATEAERWWIVSATEKHLTAYLSIICEPLPDGRNRFYAITIVHYHNWAGPVYFNIIRPFHHVVVHQMMQAGSRYNSV